MNKTQVAVSLFNKLASEYQNKFMDVSLYGDSLDLFCQNISTKNAAILELACGPVNVTRYLLDKRPDFKLLGLDLAPKMLELAKNNNPSAEFLLKDCKEITSLNKKYDAIMCAFCLPYFSKEETIKLIQDSAKCLNAKGTFYLSTMEDDYSKSAYKKGSSGEEIFMHYHEASYLIKTLEENMFNVILIDRKEYFSSDGEKVVDLIIIAELQ